MSSKGFKKGKGAKAPPKASDKEAKAAAASASANDEDEIEIENTVVDEESGQANGDGDDNVENGSEAVSNDASTEVSASTASAKGSKASSSKGKSKAPPKKNGKAPPASASSSSKASASASSSSAKPKKKSSKPSPEDWPEISVQCGTNERDIAPNARDIVVDNLSVTFHGVELIKDASLNLAWGQRYGLVGLNGTGKTTLLRALVSRKIPLPKNISVFSVQHPIEATDMSALEAVLEVDEERIELEEAATRITDKLAEAGLSDSQQADLTDALNNIYERLDEMNADTAKLRAAKLLEGLGFDPEMQQKKTRDFSGGWRMRISLARALFINPDFLVLDDASAHLDLGAVVWLEEHLKKFEKILILVSHSQDFMNGVCTNILLLRQKKLINFGGNYDTYVRTREELETNQMKQYNWEQDQIAHMKDYIARFGHGSAKLAKQAQSKEKTLEKMIRGGLTEAVTKDRVASIRFFPCGKLPPPVLQMIGITFGYPGQKKLFVNQDFGADMDSRIALVGPNGAGKSTLLKLLKGDLLPDDGMVRRHSNLRFAHFAQHTVDQLPMEETPLSYMMKEFPKDAEGNVYTLEKMRSVVGRFGITGVAQTMKIGQLSDGQKSRVVFAALAERRPNFLLLDEPSNSLDIETIDALAEAIEKWDGGVVTVSHDFRLLDRIATEIHICDHGMRKFDGDIMAYKKSLKKQMGL